MEIIKYIYKKREVYVMMNFVNIAPFLTLAAAVIGLVFAAYKFYWVKAKPEGTAQMSGIAAKIRKGAMAYL